MRHGYRASKPDTAELVCTVDSFASAKVDAAYLVLKRLIDIAVAVLALVVALPAVLLACLAITMETPGPAIYRQKRKGTGGKEFVMYKLRTMQCHSDADNFKTNWNDPRITSIGFLLRATKIDELPQFWNVLKGDMSLIGPRPLSVREIDHLTTEGGFSTEHPGLLPKTRPGLIGLEQINRTRRLSYEERFDLNHRYESNLDAMMDLSIFFKSLRMVRYVCWATAVGALFECLFGYFILG
jgi:lipopolysaccharide/colanic/teichoic acid biosynthesis glycosyltransferase